MEASVSFVKPTILRVTPETVPTVGGDIVVEGRNLGWNIAHLHVMARSIYELEGCSYATNHSRVQCHFPASTTETDSNPQYLISITLGSTVAQDDSVFVRYTPPALTSALGTTDGNKITVTGTNLGLQTAESTFKLHVSETDIVRCRINALNHTTADINCSRPGAGNTGWLLTATLGGQDSTENVLLAFETPTVARVGPGLVNTQKDTLVITGTHFGVGTPCNAFVANRACTGCVSTNDTTATCTTPSVTELHAKDNASLLFEIGNVTVLVTDAVVWDQSTLPQNERIYALITIVWSVVLVVLAVLLALIIDVLVVVFTRRHRARQAKFYEKKAVSAIHGVELNEIQPHSYPPPPRSGADQDQEAQRLELPSQQNAKRSSKGRADRPQQSAASSSSSNSSGGGSSSSNSDGEQQQKKQKQPAAAGAAKTASVPMNAIGCRSPRGSVFRSPETLRQAFRDTLDRLAQGKDLPAGDGASSSGSRSTAGGATTITTVTDTSTDGGGGGGGGGGHATPAAAAAAAATAAGLASLDAYDPANATVCYPEQFPLKLSRDRMDFNLGGRQAPVLEPMRQVLRLTNTHNFKQYFQLYLPRSERFSLHAKPQHGVVGPNKSASVTVTMTCKCTSTFDLDFIVIACPGGRREWENAAVEHFAACINISLESQLTTLLDYDELELAEPPIGVGSFGVVYRGSWRGQTVAVKVLKNQDRMLADKEFKQDFLNEVAIMEKLRHPAVLSFVGSVRLAGHYAIVTEYCPHGNLWQALQQHARQFTYALRLKCLLNCAQGMAFLHTSGILHRDLKPENLLMVSMLAANPVVCKLSDFGTTRNVNTQERAWNKRLTQGIGTPTFMAPEVLERGAYSQSADMYSFGMLAYQVYLGHDPYDTQAFRTPYDVATFVSAGKRLPIPPECPPDLAHIISRAWAQDPAARPHFVDLKEQLEQMCEEAEAEEAGKHAHRRHDRPKSTKKRPAATTASSSGAKHADKDKGKEKKRGGGKVAPKPQAQAQQQKQQQKQQQQQQQKQVAKADDVSSSHSSVSSLSSDLSEGEDELTMDSLLNASDDDLDLRH